MFSNNLKLCISQHQFRAMNMCVTASQ